MMERFKVFPTMFVISYLLVFCFGANNVSVHESGIETYIVHLKKPETEKVEDLESLYGSFVPRHRIVHSYRHVMTGFAARLTATEAKEMEKKEELVSIRPQRILSLQTTYTPTFLGLSDRKGLHPPVWDKTNFGKGVIIGVLDTGITPNHPSFSGEKIGPPPEKWQGQCDFESWVCNNKLIGARNMVDKNMPPIDEIGHGTHTASIAAGNFVKNSSFAGAASGTAVGMAPLAHLAIYKVCSSSLGSCEESAVIKGIEAAIVEGVDVISLSISGSTTFDEDAISKAAFAAVKKGVFVTCATGNSGPTRGTVTNVSPWMLTVGASTIDRAFPATVFLGSGEKIVGESLVQPTSFPSWNMPLLFPGKDGDEDAEYCRKGSLTHYNVGGKIVLCKTGGELTGRVAVAEGEEVKRLDGKAMILMDRYRYEKKRPYRLIIYDQPVLPTVHVSYQAGVDIQDYIEHPEPKDKPQAKLLFGGTSFGSPSAPMVAEFSSRGPNPFSYDVLKPDIIGPGVQILGAWLNTENNDIEKNPTFAMLSGTSMATAHLSGIVALLKSSHPDWTPPVIMSAIITTAYTKNIGNKPITNAEYIESSIFDMGAGHVDPSRANDPGLVYNIDIGADFDRKPILSELNYPSFSIQLGHFAKKVNRIVTNVGPSEATYSAIIHCPEGVDITLSVNKLRFQKHNERLSYSVTFTRQANVRVSDLVVQGHLSWVFDEYEVRSPIVITFLTA